jgi:hypothetical protein
MAVFLNWFPLAFSKSVQELPTRTFGSWEELKTFVDSRHWAKSGYVASGLRGNDQSGVRLTLVEDLSSATSELQMGSFDLGENIDLGSRAAEISLLRHLSSFGFNVRWGQFESYATQEEFRIEPVGLRVESGVSFKSYFLQYRQRYGITLDWCVKAFLEKALTSIVSVPPDTFAGMPVVLADAPQAVDEELLRYAGKYLGIVTSFDGVRAKVRCRDHRERVIPGSEILPEARPDALNILGQLSSAETGNSSLQRRMMILSFSLTHTGRKNVRILQDRLKAAIDAINPDARASIVADLHKPLAGRMRVEMSPAVARFDTLDNV